MINLTDVELDTLMKEQEPNQMIAHYTTMEGLHGLIQSVTTKGTQTMLNFWASNIFAVNDPNELMFGYDTIWKLLPKIEKDNRIPKGYRLSEIWNLKKENDTTSYNDILKESLYNNYDSNPYIISFSQSIDSLSLFRLYSNNGCGVSIVFSYVELKEQGFQLFDVIYSKGDVDIYNRDLNRKTNTLYNSYLKEIKQDSNNTDRFSIMLKHLTLLSLVVAPYIKNEDYADEREIRFSKTEKFSETVKFRLSKNGNMIPYIIQEIPVCTIKKIIIGPGADYMTAKRMIEFELRSKGIGGIPIEKSQTSYRIY